MQNVNFQLSSYFDRKAVIKKNCKNLVHEAETLFTCSRIFCSYSLGLGLVGAEEILSAETKLEEL